MQNSACAAHSRIPRRCRRRSYANAETEYGRKFDFTSIRDLTTYQQRLPILAYSDVDPYVERILAGERDVLIEGSPTFFGLTSTTTGKAKRIPFNPRVREEYVHMVGPVVACLERDFPGASRCALLYTAQFEDSISPTGITMGWASGFARRCMDAHPFWRFLPEVVYESRDADARIYTMLLFAMMRPMRSFTSQFPVVLTNMFHRATELVDALAHDLERGRFEAGPPGIQAFAAHCAPRLSPRPEAARRLRDVVRVHGRFQPSEYWTNVSTVHVWKGGTAKHGLPELRSMFPNSELRAMASGSTEASLMVPLERDWNGGVPALCSTVIEFLPADAEPVSENVGPMRDLQEGRGYRLIVTNMRGLYRYAMEDVFAIEGRYHGVPYFDLEHRIGIVSSVVNEKLTEQQVSHAVDRAIRVTGITPSGFQMAPQKIDGTGGAYRYVLRLETSAAPAELQPFLREIEIDLNETNQGYTLYRDRGYLEPAALYVMKPGYFDALLRARAATGRDVQFKLVALSTQLFEVESSAVLQVITLV